MAVLVCSSCITQVVLVFSSFRSGVLNTMLSPFSTFPNLEKRSSSLLSVALKVVAGCSGLAGENTSSSPCSHRKRPAILGSKEMYSVESHWFSSESFTSGLSKRNTRLPSWGTSSFALV